jgi:hypothetical protein
MRARLRSATTRIADRESDQRLRALSVGHKRSPGARTRASPIADCERGQRRMMRRYAAEAYLLEAVETAG